MTSLLPDSPVKPVKVQPDLEVAHYVVTAHKSSSVSRALKCSFLEPMGDNLVLAKSLRLEIWNVLESRDGGSSEDDVMDVDNEEVECEGPKMECVLEIPTRGRIVTLTSYSPPFGSLDYILYTTERKHYAIIGFNPKSKEVETKASGSLSESVGREKKGEPLCIVDPQAKMVIFHFYDGFLKIMPLCPRAGIIRDADAFNVRLAEDSALSMTFLGGSSSNGDGRNFENKELPVIAMLYLDPDENFRLTTYAINLGTRSLNDGPWNLRNEPIDASSSLIIPHESSKEGVIIVGQKQITYYNGDLSTAKTIPMENKVILCSGQVDDQRFLLGDERGVLWLLTLQQNDTGSNDVCGIELEAMGSGPIPSTVTYIAEGIVFIGTQYGDSSLIQLSEQYNKEKNSYIQSNTDFTALGPILDFATVTSNQQQAAVTCSGYGKDGTLRVIRNGIGMQEQAEVDLHGITALYALKLPGEVYDKYLLQSFIHATRMLAMEGEEMGEEAIPGFELEETTLCAANVCAENGEEMLMQVTPTQVILVRYDTSLLQFSKVDSYKASDANITIASAHISGHVALALRGGIVVFLQCTLQGIKEVVRTSMEEEVSCIHMNLFENTVFAAVGLWNDFTVRLLCAREHALKQMYKIDLGSDTQARSLAMAILDTQSMLFVGLGDGQLISYHLHFDDNDGSVNIMNRKKVSLGSQAISLNTFKSSDGKACIFAASDRPSVVYSSKGKVAYANINLHGPNDVTFSCSFHCELFPDCLALARNDSLMIGTIDDIQKLHVETYPLGETPRRIAHHESGKMFCVGCVSEPESGSSSIETNHLRFIDEGTFEEIERFNLDPYEMVLSIISCELGENLIGGSESAKPYIVVGTAYAYPEDDEPGRGRIIVFECIDFDESNGSLSSKPVRQVVEEHTNGGVYAMCSFMSNSLLATINSRIKLFVFKDHDGVGQLTSISSHHGHILSLFAKASGDYAIVGDLMRSVSVYKYDKSQGLEEIARDFNAMWTTSCELLTPSVYIGAENWNNIYTLRRNFNATSDEAKCRLITQGVYYLGEMVNKFAPGSLVMSPVSLENEDQVVTVGSSTLYATVDGSLGVVLGIDKSTYFFFKCLEKGLSQVTSSIGGISHEEFRSFEAEKRIQKSTNFVDGDLVESFLDLGRNEMAAVVGFMNDDRTWEAPDHETLVIEEDDKMPTLTIEDVILRVEEMSRLH